MAVAVNKIDDNLYTVTDGVNTVTISSYFKTDGRIRWAAVARWDRTMQASDLSSKEEAIEQAIAMLSEADRVEVHSGPDSAASLMVR